jgi:hypothetical protein
MTKAATPPTNTKKKSHLIIAPQSAGRIGKSTAAEAVLTWAKFAGIDHVILDLDAEHKTLSQRYPDQSSVFPEAASSDDGFMELLDAVSEAPAPVIVADFPAQATDHLLRQLAERNGLEILDAAGVTVTCLIFPADDTAARQSAVKCVTTLGERVKWLVVRQPGPKPLIENWSESGLGKKLAELGAGELELPRLSVSTREAYEDACKEAGRWLSLEEARETVKLTAGFEIDLWRNAVLTGCEDHAAWLIPDEALIEKRTERPKAAAVKAAPTGGLGLDL